MLLPAAAGTLSIDQPMDDQTALSAAYQGRIIIYVVEPVSRWNMYNGQPYHFGSLGEAYDNTLSINYQDTWTHTTTWTGTFTESNIMVMAAVFNAAGNQAYANPPSGNPFTAHYVDATASATPGVPGYNEANETFTHKVLVEEGTATWCPYCPAMATALYSVYTAGDCKFNFIALIDDQSPGASTRLRSELNIYGFPTAYFDGGFRVLVGGDSNPNSYRTRIKAAGARDAHDLNMTLSVTVPSPGNLQIQVSVTNNEDIFGPDIPAAPTGPTSGTIGVSYEFQSLGTHPQNKQLYYFFDWGDGLNSGWVGPYNSGVPGKASHSWNAAGDYLVKVKTKDTAGIESDWSGTSPIHISAPEYSVEVAVAKGVVTATISNDGTDEIADLDWSITMNGGFLGGINVNEYGTIATLPVGQTVDVSTTARIFGLGPATIHVGVGTLVVDKSAFVIGPFIILR
jgi:thiol-disulfide isomerase/thioredoxin